MSTWYSTVLNKGTRLVLQTIFSEATHNIYCVQIKVQTCLSDMLSKVWCDASFSSLIGNGYEVNMKEFL